MPRNQGQQEDRTSDRMAEKAERDRTGSRNERSQRMARGGEQSRGGEDETRVHAHRTAKVVELVCSSTESFQDAIECGLEDASATTRGITGAHVQNMSVKCRNGKVVEYKVDLKVAFGVERTPSASEE
jgi:flavin-binding protein dodecin